MKFKTLIKTAGLLCAAMMLAQLPVSAAYEPTSMTTNPTFQKYLIMDAGDTVPNETFSFTIVPGTPLAATSGTMAVLAGVTASGNPSIVPVHFSNAAVTKTTADASETDVVRANTARSAGAAATDDAVQLDAGEKFAKATATIDFTNVQFAEPGIYRYVITETAATAAQTAMGIVNDTDTDRILDVYVVDNGAGSAAVAEAWIYNGAEYGTEAEAQAAQTGNPGHGDITHREAQAAVPARLQVSSCVFHTDAGTVAAGTGYGSAGAALSDKTDGFTNEVTGFKDLIVRKDVTGNQASRDKYFKLTVALGNIPESSTYAVSIADDGNANTNDGNADASPAKTDATTYAANTMSNPTSVSTGSGETSVSQDFYLQHGQYVAIQGLPANATYSVTETAEDYKSTAAGVIGFTDKTATDTTDTSIGAVAGSNKAVKTSYLNERSGSIPTGIFATAGGGILILIIGTVGLVAALRTRRKA